MNTIPSEPVPDLLRIDEVEALDKASRAIDRYTSDLLVPATAMRTIHDGLLWRAVDRSWADYLRRRHKLTPRHAAHVMVRAWVEHPDTFAAATIPGVAFEQELDVVARSIAEPHEVASGHRLYRIQQAVAHLREARRIVDTHLLAETPESVDLVDWFARLKKLATDLQESAHVRHDPRKPRTKRPLRSRDRIDDPAGVVRPVRTKRHAK